MSEKRLYSEDEVIAILLNLANGIGLCAKGDIMPARYKQKVKLGGEDHWVTGRTLKDLLEAYLELCIEQGTVKPVLGSAEDALVPTVETYLKQFVKLYKSKQQALTMIRRESIINNHILPKIGSRRLNTLTVNDFQEWFNEMDAEGYSHETLLKIKNTLNPAFDAAVEDKLMAFNPLRSSRLDIVGKETVHHKAIPNEKFKEIRAAISELSDWKIRRMLALLCFTGMRMEEILGLRWEDIDFADGWIHIQRAVVHPTRNLPVVKPPKTKTSDRKIPLAEELKRYLRPEEKKGYLLWTAKDPTMETPLSYTEARLIFRKIREQFGIQEYSAHDFRDTCATEWREAGIPLDVISKILGHSKTDITEKRYVKYRDEVFKDIRGYFNEQKRTEIGQNSQG